MNPEYPGTAFKRLEIVHDRIRQLEREDLDGDWEHVRKRLLWAGGLRHLPNATPGQGYTGHSFNDFNHCDLTTMLGQVTDSKHEGGISGIAMGNHLGDGIKIASIPFGETGSGSWSTCILGSGKSPPQDVAHVQFNSKIAFKLVWCPPDFTSFVLVDDDGHLLSQGTPSGRIPALRERMMNYEIVKGSKYSVEADKNGKHEPIS
eukprot:CAMPEP_0184011932 /NCGR_PEP_ID=MMETSP0954-20121128/4099_1 /TAXON_ID=627963 /ORGANISM="Aplanochytrium sp, Strain PBS07" /LENGTH=203 /DNA_ID=CAMNT_0026291799 /DNA_START=280 /DNA_END=891 /DNA_ORIENTATION=+